MRADARSREDGGPKVTWMELARRVAYRLDAEQAGHPSTGKAFQTQVSDQIRAARTGKTRWHHDMIEAIASSLGTLPERLVAEDYEAGKVPEADRGEYLARALGRSLTLAEVRQTVRALNLSKEAQDGSWALLWKLFDDIRTASTGEEAASRAHNRVLQWWRRQEKPAKSQQESETGK
ncbi:MAG: hypothetical protein NXI30_04395 [bacterium]|nr:hypothetical protein [bacterium]